MPICNFFFQRQPPAYNSGETVSGNVQLETSSERNIIDICCVFCGKARVRWVDSLSRYPKTYIAEHTYFEERTVVYEGDTLQMGMYDFAFEVKIPDECPTTCTTEFGSVRYDISLEVNEVGNMVHHYKREVTVMRPLILSDYPELGTLRTDEAAIHFCWWPCAAGPLLVSLSSPRGGYVPNEEVKYEITMENHSKRFKVTGQFIVNLLQVYKFTALMPRRKTRYKTIILERVEHEGTCERDGEATIDGQLTIPKTPPSSQGTELILMKYEIRLQVNLQYSQGQLELAVPIVIGSDEGVPPTVVQAVRNELLPVHPTFLMVGKLVTGFPNTTIKPLPKVPDE